MYQSDNKERYLISMKLDPHMNNRRLTVRTKLTLAFSLLTCMVLLVSILGIVSLGNANAAFDHYVNGTNARAILADKVRVAVDRRAIAARNQVLATAPRDADIEKDAALQADHDVGALLGELTNAVREGAARPTRPANWSGKSARSRRSTAPWRAPSSTRRRTTAAIRRSR